MRPFVEVIVFEGSRVVKRERARSPLQARKLIDESAAYLVANTSNGCMTITSEAGVPLVTTRAQMMKA